MTERAYVDANVILRFLTKDPADQARQSAALFDAVDQGDIALVLDEIIVAEVVWVLQSFYEFPRDEIAATLQDLVAHEGMEAENKHGLLEALRLFADKNVDFADALTAVHMADEGVREIYSFDRHFDRLGEVVRREPGSDSPRQATKP